ncbi:MAG: protein kinase [Pirellulaceae bacterium]|nr:protein kinase [Pirellulaceae bacterium]
MIDPLHPSDPNNADKPATKVGRGATKPSTSVPQDETMDCGTEKNVPETIHRSQEVEIPETIGRYRVEKVLGQGGFGCVYLAYDDELQRHVTLKVPHSHRIKTAEDVDAFLTEARTLAKLEHPNVVPVHDVGTTDEGVCYIVSRYIDGNDLYHRIRTSPLSIGDAVEMVATIAEALHYVHTHGIVHRDIKPNNLLLDKRGVAYIADFGLALLEDGAAKSNTVTGTPAYMSPEQARGENHLVQGTSDIFSLGVVLYEMITGERPFKGKTAQTILRHVQEQEATPLREINSDIPAELERICMKSISKRATNRHTTAIDFAEDLRHFLSQDDGLDILSGKAPVVAGSTSQRSRASRQFLGIVPKGLRSFGAEDAHFFLGLLPGPYDRSGTPESILFWKRRIEELDPENTFRVGLLYGPSGCGKSSFVKAGLIPTLTKNVTSVFVEAAPDATETRLLHRLRRRCPYLDTELDLRESIATLRHGKVMGEGKKILIVIDQFEQWLYSIEQPEHSELAKALRQCDGEHVQCVLLVRDDFWLAFSRFMDHLEVDLLQNQNMALVDLFDQMHARRVLTEFGRAFQRLPEHHSESTRDQRSFVTQAIEGLSENGKVIPVRIALFAEMIKGKPWTTSTLRKIGGTAGVGVLFLDESFVSENAPADYRIHQKAVHATLGALLPEPGTNLKGHMKSRDELLQASGYADQPKQFELLMRALDNELHLITRTDPEGRVDDITGTHSKIDPSSKSVSLVEQNYYQLAHDYLVPSIREWRSRMQRETRKGRAEIRLVQRTEIWKARPERRHLPTWTEWVSIMTLTQRKRWDSHQQRMMDIATRRHSMMTVLTLLAMLIAGLGVYHFRAWNRAHSLTDQLATANVAQVSGLLTQLNDYQRWTGDPLVQLQSESVSGSQPYLFSTLALIRSGRGDVQDIQDALFTADPETLALLSDELRPHHAQLREALWKVLQDDSIGNESDKTGRPFNRRFNAALVLASYDTPGNTAPATISDANVDAEDRWTQQRDFIADQLIYFANIDRQYYASIIDLIRPATNVIVDRLTNVMIDHSEKELRRSAAQTLLIDLLHSDAPVLTDKFLLADDDQLPPALALIDANRDAVRPVLDEALETTIEFGATDWQRNARRKAVATALLLRHGASSDAIWAVFRDGRVPDTRTQLIGLLATLKVDPAVIAQQLQVEQDDAARSGLIQALGGFSPSDLNSDLRNRTVTLIKGWFNTATTAKVRSSSLWFLRRWDGGDWIQDTLTKETPPAPGRDWYVNSQGQTMITLPYRQSDHDYRIEASIGETTVQQLRRFDPECNWSESYAPTMDCPVTNATYHTAVAYCNWLSRTEGIDDDQLCYPDREDGPGDAVELYPDYRQRTGYRLPTAEEWFFMNRGGAVTDFSFGHDNTLADGYANFNNEGRRGWPLGSAKPNGYGIFDLICGTREWVSEVDPDNPRRRGLCGMSFRYNKETLEPRQIGFGLPDLSYSFHGFRVVRSRPVSAIASTMPALESTSAASDQNDP